MLLRRITKDLKNQNWTAVILDLAIVVFGVFIGIQVSNWNEERRDQLAATQVLASLERDFEEKLARTDRSLEMIRRNLKATGRLIHGIRSGTFDENTLQRDVIHATSTATPPGPSTTFLELVADGRLALIRSDDLRRQLYDYNDYVTLVRSSFPFFISRLAEAKQLLAGAYTIEASGEPSTSIYELEHTLDVNRAMLLSDPSIHSRLQLAYATQDNTVAMLEIIRTRLVELLQLLTLEQAKGLDAA